MAFEVASLLSGKKKHLTESLLLREPQHTPGAYPRHPQLGYVPGVCWKILGLLDVRQTICALMNLDKVFQYLHKTKKTCSQESPQKKQKKTRELSHGPENYPENHDTFVGTWALVTP